MNIWILSAEVNMYDQQGEYFVAAYINKPTKDQISDTLCTSDEDLIDHILNGGGRRGYEDDWYVLEEVEEGTNCYE